MTLLEKLKQYNLTPEYLEEDADIVELMADNKEYESFVDDSENYWEAFDEYLKSLDLEYQRITDYNSENDSDTISMVLYFPSWDVYIRADGYYSSYSGSDWQDATWYEVKPKEKVIKVFE